MVSLRIACGCLLLLAPAFAGCRDGTGSSADAPIRVGVGADRYLTELPSRPDLGKYPLNTGIFDTLVRMTESLDIEPMLAERWTYARDTNTWQFMLRRRGDLSGRQPPAARCCARCLPGRACAKCGSVRWGSSNGRGSSATRPNRIP